MRRVRAALVIAAVVAVAALPGAPASAAAEATDLSAAFDPGAGVVRRAGVDSRMVVVNHGPAAATGITVTLDVVEIDDGVTVSVPPTTAECARTGHVVTCALGRLEPGRSVAVVPLRLAWGAAAEPGSHGGVRVDVTSDQAELTPGDNSFRLPVGVVPPEAIPVSLVSDLGAARHRVGPGDTLPLYAAVRNRGDLPLTEFNVIILVPLGAAPVERYRDCAYSSRWRDGGGPAYHYDAMRMECHVSVPLQPGETLPLFDPATRASLFHVTFGRNLPGPDRLEGVLLASAGARPAQPGNPAGPSFTDAPPGSRCSPPVRRPPAGQLCTATRR